MSKLIIRKADEDDILRIAELEELCFPMPWSVNSIANEIINNEKALYIVGEIEGKDKKVVSYMGVWQILDEGHITNVCVDPVYRRNHIAYDMMETMIEVTSKMGINKWTLEVRKSNYQAISLYTKLGFKEVGVRKGYYEDNKEDAVIMWKGLSDRVN